MSTMMSGGPRLVLELLDNFNSSKKQEYLIVSFDQETATMRFKVRSALDESGYDIAVPLGDLDDVATFLSVAPVVGAPTFTSVYGVLGSKKMLPRAGYVSDGYMQLGCLHFDNGHASAPLFRVKLLLSMAKRLSGFIVHQQRHSLASPTEVPSFGLS